jgi:hypothetical protein
MSEEKRFFIFLARQSRIVGLVKVGGYPVVDVGGWLGGSVLVQQSTHLVFLYFTAFPRGCKFANGSSGVEITERMGHSWHRIAMYCNVQVNSQAHLRPLDRIYVD